MPDSTKTDQQPLESVVIENVTPAALGIFKQRELVEKALHEQLLRTVNETKGVFAKQFHWLTPNQAAFLGAFCLVGSITKASRLTDVNSSRHYDWLTDPAYKRCFQLALRIAIERLEEEARRRAVEGVLKPQWYQASMVAWCCRIRLCERRGQRAC